MNHHLAVFTLIIFLSIFPLSWESRANNFSPSNFSEGVVFLDDNFQTVNGKRINVLTQSMMNRPNTVYIIQNNYSLTSNIRVPDNSSLKFEGGSIVGNNTTKLILNSCFIDGDARFRNVIFDGNIKNGDFNVLWIENGDIGDKINKANVNFDYLYVPAGEYVFSTPVKIRVKGLRCEGYLKYNGNYINNQGIFIITCSGANVHVVGLEPYNRSKINYLDTRKTNAVGLELRGCNNSEFHIDRMQYFNENIRISDLDGTGCSYNKFFLGVIASGNFNIRLYQQDNEKGKISWTNENHFFGGRLTHWTENAEWGEYYNIGVGGPAIDKPSYKNRTAKDHEDTCNGLTFIGTSIETNRISLLLRNVTDSQFIGMRQESSPGFAKIIGAFERIYYIPKFTEAANILNSDFTEATSVSFVNYNDIYNIKSTIEIDRNITIDNKLVQYTGYVCDKQSLKDISPSYMTQVGALLKTGGKDICAAVFVNKATRIYIRFLDSKGNNITENYMSAFIGYQLAYYPSYKAFLSTTDVLGHQIHLPCSDGKNTSVFIGCDAGKSVDLLFYANNTIETPSIIIKGPSSEKPVGLPANVQYFDTEKNKPLWWNGTHWVDASGKIQTER